jgi:hypothetical protein
MRFVVFLLALVAAVTAVGTLLIGMMTIFKDNLHDPTTAWRYGLIVAAAAGIALSLIAAIVIWISPRAAAGVLWAVVLAGVAAMAAEGVIMFLVRNDPNAPNAYKMLTAVALAGAAPTVAATAAALITSYLVLPRRTVAA